MGLIVVIITVALFFDFLNGFHDSANSIATVVATRVLKPQQAVLMAAFANFISAFVFSTAVATTIAKGIIEPSTISSTTILAALIASCAWNITTWYLGLPISSSHALIGSLIGATYIQFGPSALISSGIIKTLTFIFVAPILGFGGAILFTLLTIFIVKKQKRQTILPLFNKLQLLSSFMYSLGHGSNDAQKTMGIITLTLFSNGMLGVNMHVPLWVILSSHAAIAAGTYFGGWKIVKTMATKLIHLRPFEGFCAETSSAIVIFFSSHFGIPVSTTHIINGSIVGVGSTQNYHKVRWINTRQILLAWVLTIPISFILGGIGVSFIRLIIK